ncbi:unnamed protein product [Thelazia callipaeda]|uniref:Uncharacterized protein n=1 Tax=Thelazia callipaeda TaxID=103827 RepID=A0A0N5D8P2_THECL|nr:unnamed protein product [Thelazia callipaeda]
MSADELFTSQTRQYRLCNLELSDDGSSSVVSESEPEKRQTFFVMMECKELAVIWNLLLSKELTTLIVLIGIRRISNKLRKRSSKTPTKNNSMLCVGSNGAQQRSHNSPLPTYPVSIRQQLAIIKQV